jgi:PAS domain S-box-containing protein
LLEPFYHVSIVDDAAEALAAIRECSPHLILIDADMLARASGSPTEWAIGHEVSPFALVILTLDRELPSGLRELPFASITVVDPDDDLAIVGAVGAGLSSSLLASGATEHQPPPGENETNSGKRSRGGVLSYEQLVEKLPVAAYLCDAHGWIIAFNKGASELWGRTPVLGADRWSGSWQMFHPDGRQIALDQSPMALALRMGRPQADEENIIVRPDGTQRRVVSHPQLFHDSTGKLIGAINILLDVTELSSARQRIHEHHVRTNAILNSVLDAIITICLDGTIESVNDAAETMFGYTADEMIGRNVSMLMPPPYRDEHDQYLANYLRSGVPKIIGSGREMVAVRKDGSEFPVELAVTEVKLARRRLFAGVVKDISQRKHAERTLRDSEERFRTLTEKAPVAIFIKDLEGRYTFANSLACEALGRPQGVAGMTDHELLPPDIADLLRQRDLEVISTGEAGERIEVVNRPGFHGDYLSVKFPLRNADGETIGVCGVATDITERRRAQDALRESEERFVRFMHHLPGLAWIKNVSGQYVYDNEAASKAFQTPLDALYGKTDANLFDAETAEQFQENDRRALESASGIQTVETLELPDGIHYSFVNKFPIPGPDGAPLLVGGMAFDVTDQKQAEEALRESEERFRTLARNAPVGIFMSDRDGGTIFVNDGWCAMTGLTLDQARGSGWVEALHPEDRDRVLSGWEEAVRNGVDSSADFRFIRPDGTITWLQGNAVPLHDSVGNVTGYIGTVMDITGRKQVEHELRSADRRKDEFLAMLAHELRNPLAPIRTGLEVMRLAHDDQTLVEEVRATIERQTQVMARLVDDLLDVSRITRGAVELRKTCVDLASLVHTAVETAEPAINERNHQLTISLPDQPILLDVDPTRLEQVIANLLNNAAKYTDPGGTITLTACRQDNWCDLSVKDSGVGIPSHMLDHVFEMFTQVDRSAQSTSRTSGLGIGLTLVHRLVEMHGGTVEARSPGLGQGSEFIVRLPIAVPDDKTIRRQEDQHPFRSPQRRVLVADDNETAAVLLAILLKKLGHEVRTVSDGEAAVQAAADFRPEIVFLDLGMPKLNGYEAARRIRDNPWGQSTILAALTGWGQEEDKQRTKQAGFNYHFVKPIEPATLRELLDT